MVLIEGVLRLSSESASTGGEGSIDGLPSEQWQCVVIEVQKRDDTRARFWRRTRGRLIRQRSAHTMASLPSK
mgnify:CR=1 FL=1